MRAFIIGAGAVGRYFASRLRLGGHDVTLLARPDAAAALRADGIVLRVDAQEWPVSVTAVSTPADPRLREPFELAIVAVKSFSTPETIDELRTIPGCAEATILTVQNGLGNEEAFANAFGADRIAAGALTTAVDRDGSNAVVATDKGGLSFAPVGTIPHNWLIASMEGTGLEVRAAGDWRALKWSKLCINLLGNGVCAALDWTPAQVYADATAFAVERACLLEAVAAMRALAIAPVALVGFPVPVLVAAARSLPPALLKLALSSRVKSARGEKLPSLLLDLRAHRTLTEVDDLNGAVAAHARKAGLATPANDAVARIVSGIASGTIDWNLFRGKPQALAASAGMAA
jgi:2-dehydropantoate 2-reductase